MRTRHAVIRTLGCSALFLWATSAPFAPLSAAVESNVVGYSELKLEQGNNLLACSFEGLQDEGTDIQSLLRGNFEPNDRIQFFSKDGTYETYTYRSQAIVVEDGGWSVSDSPAWVDYQGIRASRVVAPGEPFWINVKTAKSVTTAGAVSVNPQQLELRAGTNMIAFAYPGGSKGNAENVNVLEQSKFSNNDTLMVYDANTKGYATYRYRQNPIVMIDGSWEVSKTPGWCDYQGQKVDIVISESAGFWVIPAQPMTLTFDSPLR